MSQDSVERIAADILIASLTSCPAGFDKAARIAEAFKIIHAAVKESQSSDEEKE